VKMCKLSVATKGDANDEQKVAQDDMDLSGNKGLARSGVRSRAGL
jgi:hypothetical protein